MRYLIFLILTTIISPVFAGPICTEYVLYKDSFTLAQRNVIKNYGRKQDRQPGLETKLDQYDFDSNLYKLTITTMAPVENTAVLAALNLGAIQKIRSWEIVTEFDGREMQTFVGNRQEYMPEPVPYSVEITTP